jgi:hypothetical protein
VRSPATTPARRAPTAMSWFIAIGMSGSFERGLVDRQ